MRTIQASEAKTHFLRLLDDIEKGETIVITRHGKPVAQITPQVQIDREKAHQAFESIRELRKRTKPTSLDEILAWRDEGRI